MTRQGLILANPAADLELPRLEKRLPRTILSVEQVEEVLGLCDLTTLQGVRDRALMELAVVNGYPSRRGGPAGNIQPGLLTADTDHQAGKGPRRPGDTGGRAWAVVA